MNKLATVTAIFLGILPLVQCGGGGGSSTSSSVSTPSVGVLPSNPHPNGVWSTLPVKMPINPVHAALLNTGKVLIISGSGNCPPQQAGCPRGQQYPQGAALWDYT